MSCGSPNGGDTVSADVSSAPAAAPVEPPAASAPRGRVVILGFDGVEPSIVREMIARGELRNLANLEQMGAFTTLRSTIPPQSPTAWNSFATCKNPGGHGIYDFVRRNPRHHFPEVGTSRLNHPAQSADGAITRAAAAVGYRKGETFWSVADRAGRRCRILNVPFAFPPDQLRHGSMLCGLDVPEIRGSQNSFYAFSDAFTREQLDESVAGGRRFPLEFRDGVALVTVPTARIPQASNREAPRFVEVPIEFTLDRDARRLTISAQEHTLALDEGQWSDWVEWTFEATPKFQVRAISRFYLIEAGEHVRLYMTALQFHPRAPYVPITQPEGLAGDLADRYGLYKTLGWAHDTHALRQDAITEEAFLEDAFRTMDWRAMVTLDELDRDDFDILISCWTAPDRVGHMFWRFRDPEHPLYNEEGAARFGEALEDVYRRMDEIVGKVMPKIRENDLFVVMSDHGFETFRRGFNLNTWLVRNGYAVIEGQDDPETAVGEKGFLEDFDWSRTRAYAIGLSSLYLNIQGREGKGIVPPGEAAALIDEIRGKLLEVTDPANGARVFDAIYTRDVYSGVARVDAPDILLGYALGYQNTKGAARGAAPAQLFEDNTDKWSGEHVASDVERVPGMFFANRPIHAANPDIIDLGVTTLNYAVVPVPADFEGKDLLGS